TNTSLDDLRNDVQAAIDAATFTVTESSDLGHPVGASYQPTQSPAELRVALRDGKLVWTSPFTIQVDGASVHANLLGFDVQVGQTQSSETRYSIAAPGVGSVINIGPAVTVNSGGSPQLYLGGRILAHTGVNLFGGWQSGDLQLTPQGLNLDYSGAIELLEGSILFDGGDTYELKGELIAHGANADVMVNATNSLVISGRISAGDKAELLTTATGGTLTLRPGSRVDAGNVVTLQADGLVEIDGLVGSMVAPTALVVSSLSDNVHVLSGSGRLQASETVTVLAQDIDFAGVLVTTGATADADDFEVTLTAPGSMRLSGKFDTSGSVQVSSPTIAIYDFTAKQSGADSRWSILTQEDDFTFGRILTDGNGRAVAHAAQIQAVKSLELSVATRITVAAGSQLSVSGDNGQLKLAAPTVDIIGGLYAGATFDADGDPSWVGRGADITLDGENVTIGGIGPDANGTMVTRGGLVAATGLISITAHGAGLDSSFKLEGPSRIQTTTVVAPLGIQVSDPPAVVITSDGSLRIFGVIDAQGDGADVTLWAPGEILIDGVVHADDELRATSGGGDPVSIYLTQLLLKTDAFGHLLDDSGRMIDQQGNLINAAGQYVDATGAVLPPGATPVLGGAPVRLSGGSLDGGKIVLSGPTNMNLLGQIGKLDVVNNALVSGSGSLIVTTPADVDIAGRIQVENSIDIRGANLTIAPTGAVIGRQLVHLLADHIDFRGYVGGAGLVVLNSVGDFEVRGVVQSGGDVHVNAGIDRSWTDQQLRSATLAAADLEPAYVYVLGSGVLDATGAVRIAAGGDFKLAADAVVTPNLTSVSTPLIVQQERTIDVVVGTRIVEDGTVTEDEVHYVPTTVTEQTGTTLVKIGTAYHTLDIKLSQDGYFNGHTIREYFVQNVDYQNEEIPWTSYSRQADGKVVFTGQTPAPDNPVPAPDILATFAQLTDDQQNVVLAHLGYMKLYNFSYT
ncbi:MAG TPA: hypothetical protein PLV92_12300, partial [Pirellulaceae bacterium]|nr:hypothetical protein [Pirellulaceae bacterium]